MNPTKVTTRVPRFWYGIEITNIFDPAIDPPEYKVTRPDGSVRCDNRFSTYVERGKPLGKSIHDAVGGHELRLHPSACG